MIRAERGGILALDKPRGPTSHDAVARVRKKLGTRKVGHTGTLDPFATGLLLLCVGPTTRLSEYLTGLDKSYEAVARLGVATDTLDDQGRVVARSDGWRQVDRSALEAALEGLRGEILQVPPQFSAKKVGGEAMHRRARRGERVELEPRPVTVHELEITGLEPPELRFRVRCSSGTYVRALARDLGETLEVGAHLTDLRRTAVGGFRVEDAPGWEALEPGADLPEEAWIPPLAALAHLPLLEVDADEARALADGRILPRPDQEDVAPLVVAHRGELVAVAAVRDGRLRPRKVFAPAGVREGTS